MRGGCGVSDRGQRLPCTRKLEPFALLWTHAPNRTPQEGLHDFGLHTSHNPPSYTARVPAMQCHACMRCACVARPQKRQYGWKVALRNRVSRMEPSGGEDSKAVDRAAVSEPSAVACAHGAGAPASSSAALHSPVGDGGGGGSSIGALGSDFSHPPPQVGGGPPTSSGHLSRPWGHGGGGRWSQPAGPRCL